LPSREGDNPKKSVAIISNLECNSEYEFYVARVNDLDKKSSTRLAKTGFVPGTVVNYLHPEDDIYSFSGRCLCSPSLVILESGKLLASMDVYAEGYPQNLTLIFKSDDNGESWSYVTDLFSCFWGKLFVHRQKLYMLANTTEYGDLILGCSEDEGETWSTPVTILPGSGSGMAGGPHKAPMPIIEHNGRLCTAVDYGSWTLKGHKSAILSIDVDTDLMIALNWCYTEPLAYDPLWTSDIQGDASALEGNAVVSLDGQLYNILRYQIAGCIPNHGKAIMLKADAKDFEKALEFHNIVDFYGGSNSKFDILQDPVTKKYIAIVNEVMDEKTPCQRNVLSLAVSEDLFHWKPAIRLLDYKHLNPMQVGFQYISSLICGDDIYFLSRTAFNGARNYHDANYSTFHKIENFRDLIK